MDKKARISSWLVAIFTLIVIVSFMYFVFAERVVMVSTPGGLVNGYNYSVNEDMGYVYNISVNYTDVDGLNNLT